MGCDSPAIDDRWCAYLQTFRTL